MNPDKKVLICGGGVAGPACAYWLNKYGYTVVVAEKAPGLRDGGQNVDIKGAGQRVIEKMGLVDAVIAKDTQEQGQKYLDAAGHVVATLPKQAFGSLTNDFEILRGDFARILYDLTQDQCEYRFDTVVAYLEEKSHCVSVTFGDRTVEDFEFVVCAEGMGSSTRQMVMAQEVRFRYLGAHMSFFNIPRRPEDDHWALTVNGLGGTFLTLRPGNDTETTVLLTFLAHEDGTPGDAAAPKDLLRRALDGRGTIADRVSSELDAVEDFYFGPMSQVHVSRWSKGRVVLVGDAAYCPTPFTGSGTALALVGAYVLAGELSRHRDHAEAFVAYERLVRPYAEAAQNQLTPALIRFIHVKTRLEVALAHLLIRGIALGATQRIAKLIADRRGTEVADEFVLADYF
ncbi:FAD-dependent monooxygenase [Mycolicibacterium sphagni]|uniref:FAD-dependent monooxygenase n=1 Tax=Mycolicibacterium sphagni TaxID=1786 RepID=UPI0013FE4314|nr:FAD-dependent monooxygenase [Mycolicibacterium sphagni]